MVEWRVVVAIVGDCIADLLVFRAVAVEIGEEISHHFVRVFRLFSHCFLLLLCSRRKQTCCQ